MREWLGRLLRTPAHEIYKCVALTAIVVLLAINTFGVQRTRGQIDGTVDVGGEVRVEGPVEVEGTVDVGSGTVDVSGSSVFVVP